jgi:phosphonate metabolism protein (transferase hexapeptide repeat family)
MMTIQDQQTTEHSKRTNEVQPRKVYDQEPTAQRLSTIPYVHPTSTVHHATLGEWVSIGANSKIIESDIGAYSYTAGDADIIYATVGKFCSIASHVRINPGNHPMWRVTQHHMTYRRMMYQLDEKDDHDFFDWRKADHVTIGHDVWIGHNAIIMPGVTIGTGAVIGSGAVVTKSVQPYEIVVGVPAKPIRKRFSEDVIELLLASEWWNWSRELIEERMNALHDLDQFIEAVRSGQWRNPK